MNDEFYIGYLDACPPATLRWVRRAVLWAAVCCLGAVVLAAWRQTPADPGIFEFGQVREFEGTIMEAPFPILHVDLKESGVTNYVLVGEGKHAAPTWFAGRHGHQVTFRGTLIQKDKLAMIEVAGKDGLKDSGEVSSKASFVPHWGGIELRGELVDTKCYFGVMRPAVGKVHRACAVRCLSGGVPPGLLIRDGSGNAVVALLTGEDGLPLSFDPQWAARNVRVRGELELRDNLPLIHVSQMVLAD
jgi:hypothetical protein